MSQDITVKNKKPGSEVAESGSSPAARPERVIRLSPRTDVLETKDAYVLLLDMPGVGAGNVSVHFEEGVVSIKGEAKSPAGDGRKPLHRVYESKEYYRSFQVPDGVNASTIDAQIKDGVLTLTLPKAEEIRPRQIEVKPS